MALDFPSSPTNGQVYNNWIYSTAKGAWEAKPLTPGVAATSDTPPLAPKDGDVWYNTNDGSAYVYYIDVDGGQWVQIKSDATLSSTLGTRVSSLEATPSGLVPMIPSSVSVGSGSATVNSTGTISFTGASSVSINDVFNSNYINYLVKLETACSANSDIRAQFRRLGANYTGTNQHQAGILVNWSGTVSSFSAINTAHIGLGVTVGGVDKNFSSTINLSNPQRATPTTSQIHSNGFIAASAMNQTVMSFGNYQSEQYDGMTFFPAAGGSNMTGSIQVYGYR